MNLTVETDREEDGRWIAEVRDLADALAHGKTRDEAIARAEAPALRVLADRLEHAEARPDLVSVTFRQLSPERWRIGRRRVLDESWRRSIASGGN
jgi:predicted RNase H-like HicB family nuclease